MRALINTTLCDLQAIELEQAARVVSCGMRDNPVNVRAFRIEDTDRRSRALARFFGPVLRGLHKRGMIKGAFRDNALVGVCGMAQPGSCQLTLLEKIEVWPSLVCVTAWERPFGS